MLNDIIFNIVSFASKMLATSARMYVIVFITMDFAMVIQSVKML